MLHPLFALGINRKVLASGSYVLLIVLLLCFLPSFSFAQENQIGSIKTIQNVSFKLLSNTTQCLANCEAWIELDTTSSLLDTRMPSQPNTQFNFEIQKQTSDHRGLVDYGVEVW